jgi:hypothetical protein
MKALDRVDLYIAGTVMQNRSPKDIERWQEERSRRISLLIVITMGWQLTTDSFAGKIRT